MAVVVTAWSGLLLGTIQLYFHTCTAGVNIKLDIRAQNHNILSTKLLHVSYTPGVGGVGRMKREPSALKYCVLLPSQGKIKKSRGVLQANFNCLSNLGYSCIKEESATGLGSMDWIPPHRG